MFSVRVKKFRLHDYGKANETFLWALLSVDDLEPKKARNDDQIWHFESTARDSRGNEDALLQSSSSSGKSSRSTRPKHQSASIIIGVTQKLLTIIHGSTTYLSVPTNISCLLLARKVMITQGSHESPLSETIKASL